MSSRFMKIRVLLLALVLALLAPALRSEEGMWPFDMVPRERWKKRFGVELSDAWLKHLQLSCVRFNSGGSGSFVSPDGLVLTNQHIASDIMQKISDEEHDYIKAGFLARKREDEIKAPDLELDMLVGIDDVTARVDAAVKPEMNSKEAFEARRAVIAQIEKEESEKTGMRCDVMELYRGAVCSLYRYKRFTDVRLVFAPEADAAFFGGDPDNFTYPRYCLDMALVRVYENDRPVKPEHYLRWSAEGPKEGDITFVAGHPGSTARLDTPEHLEFERDVALPYSVASLQRQSAMLKAYAKQGGEERRQSQSDAYDTENSLKNDLGELEGLKDGAIIAVKREEQKRLREKLAGDHEQLEIYDKAVERVARARKDLREWYKELYLVGYGAAFNSTLCGHAWTLVRLAEERAKPNTDRLPEYTDARREALELELFSTDPIYTEFEITTLTDSFEFLRSELGDDNPWVKTVLAGKAPKDRARELIEGSKLADPAARKALADAGKKGIAASQDPLIKLFREIDPETRRLSGRYEKEVVSVERDAYAQIARSIFKAYDREQYPDATFSLRLCVGQVKGYEEKGAAIASFTTMQGLFDRAAMFENKPPFAVPQSWAKARDKLKLDTPFNYVTTNDIVGGNSGSPVVNQKGELVGLIFDGNIQSLLGDFIFDETVNRSVVVDPRAMIEALRKIYDAGFLADELTK